MSKIMTILIAILVLLGSFLVIRYAKDSYKILPFDEKDPLKSGLNASSTNFQDWKEFDEPDGTFDALFPILPQHVSDKIADPITKEPRKYNMYAAADESGTGFIISTITFPQSIDAKDIDTVLRNPVNDMLSRNKDNKLKMSKVGKFNDHDTIDFALENNDVTVAGKVILYKNVLYVLSMADKTSTFNMDELRFFLNSFHMHDKGSGQVKVQKAKIEPIKPPKADLEKASIPDKKE